MTAGRPGRGRRWGRAAEPPRAGQSRAEPPGRSRAGQPRARQARAGATVGGEQVEGRQAVRELLAAGRRPVREVWLAEGADDAPILAEIESLAAAGAVPVRRVARSRLAALARTDAPQGVVALAVALAETDLETMVAAHPPAGDSGPTMAWRPFLLVLDGVTDPRNLGALLRNAECAGVTGAVLPRHRAAHVTPAVTKAAAGAIEHLAFAVVPGIPAAISALSGAGVWTVGLDPAAPTSLWALEVATEPVAIVLGAEGQGLSRLTRERCDLLVAIPQRGAIDSLNVAAAGALACFEVARRRMAAET